MVKIGINGFGRLARLLLRISIDQSSRKCIPGDKNATCGSLDSNQPSLVAINNPNVTTNTTRMSCLLKRDSVYGPFNKCIKEKEYGLLIDDHKIKIIQEPDVTSIEWNKYSEIDYMIDTTNMNITCAEASRHLRDRIRRVIVIGANDASVFILGVNQTCYKPNIKVVSIGTPSLNCLAPMLRVLHENFTIKNAIATIIHPLNCQDKILDSDDTVRSPHRNLRSAILNYIPVQSDSGKYISRIIPELEGKIGSTAIKIAIPCVGAVDLTVILEKDVSYDMVKKKFQEASQCYMKGIIRYTDDDDLVSSDIIGDPYSCVFDANAGIDLDKGIIKLFAWYDAEYAFAHRIYDMIRYISSREICK